MRSIQNSKTQRDKAMDFVRNMECLRLINGESPDELMFERVHINVFDEPCAPISYTWGPSTYEDEEAGGYIIQGRNGRGEPSEVRNCVLRRAAAFLRYIDVDNLWIDKECIVQHDSEEKETAMHAMDLVYQYAGHPFGLLTTLVKDELQLLYLALLLLGDMVKKDMRGYKLSRGTTIARAWDVLQLLDTITCDKWWTRAWTFQENYRGAEEMCLLMPHNPSLDSVKAKVNEVSEDLIGDLNGELVIGSIQFSEETTKLCLAFLAHRSPSHSQREVAKRILSAAGRYSIVLGKRHSMSPTVISDVDNRDTTEPANRLAIVANCCGYDVRLESNVVDVQTHDAGLAMLVMFVLNGEILQNSPDGGSLDVNSCSGLTAMEFLQKHAFQRFNPPAENYQLTFNKGCRFVDVSLEPDGVHTSGRLWKLRQLEIKFPRHKSKRWNNTHALRRLRDCIRKRPHCQENLAARLDRHLKQMRKPPPNAAADHMACMTTALASAIRKGKSLRLGYRPNSSKRFSPPMGIFICPDGPDQDGRPEYVFTSFKEKADSGPSAYTNDVDKYVSLQVGVESNETGPPRLFAKAWINGLYFATEMTEEVVFPLPGVLGQL
ncbi:hypothetical protein CGCTS75_v011342 [Colletotrichum tropicale]|nr:hypothetical protein CGCTS75_v011342 [Colletotrichum tropicale]